MKVARRPEELASGERAVAIGSFDGVHLGHRRVLEAARSPGLPSAVVTFWPHPRLVLGNRVELLTTLERRLELLQEAGVDEVLVVDFTPELARLEPGDFGESLLRKIEAAVIAVGESFRFGRGASGDAASLERLGFDVRVVPTLDGVSSTTIRGLLREGDVVAAAQLLGRPPEVEGTVVLGDQRGGTLGYPTANLATPPNLLVPASGIYAGAALGHRAAISIGVNPHYYGERLIVELWERLRDERAFASEDELVAQIARDVERAGTAARPG